jgi:hypothetical protein
MQSANWPEWNADSADWADYRGSEARMRDLKWDIGDLRGRVKRAIAPTSWSYVGLFDVDDGLVEGAFDLLQCALV